MQRPDLVDTKQSIVRAVELEILYEIEIPSVRMVGVGRFVTFAAPQFQQQVIGGKQINKSVALRKTNKASQLVLGQHVELARDNTRHHLAMLSDTLQNQFVCGFGVEVLDR